mgnify:CR=1 FL=1
MAEDPKPQQAPGGGARGLGGMAWLLAFQTLGELLSRALALPLPGPVLGLVLLLVGLRWAPVRQSVALAAEFLLAHLSLLFVPVAVGVMAYLPLLSVHGLRLAVVIVLSTWAGLLVTAAVLHRLAPKASEDA